LVYNQARRNDELLRFIHDARTEDFHEGTHTLNFSTYVSHFSSDKADPPPPNAKLTIGTDGLFWVIDEGTPGKRRIPIKQGGSYEIAISIDNAPTKHRGNTLAHNDPLTLCQLALDYYSELVFEATAKFSSSTS
jgi:hypothetical protein